MSIHSSNGPVSTMPGSAHEVPPGIVCDIHSDRKATHRVQGETDSYGCEYLCMCDQCFLDFNHQKAALAKEVQRCDWCRKESADVRPTRDYDEGTRGPVYDVCGECRARQNANARAELDDYDTSWF